MSERTELALEGECLAVGSSVRMVCPFCRGGRSREATLVLTHTEEGALLFVCHRANCGASGRLGVAGVGGACAGPAPRQPRTVPPESLSPLSAEICESVFRSWGVSAAGANYRWHEESGRLAMPVLSPTRRHRGWVLRELPGVVRHGRPKSLTFREDVIEPWVHWAHGPTALYLNEAPTHLLIVEDIPSADRLAQAGVTACALMGTHIAATVEDEILRVGEAYRVLHVALDRDAVKKSIDYKEKLALRRHCQVFVPVPDFKDMSPVEFHRCLESVGY